MQSMGIFSVSLQAILVISLYFAMETLQTASDQDKYENMNMVPVVGLPVM